MSQDLEAKLARICTNHKDRPRPIGEIVLADGTVRNVYPARPALTDTKTNARYYIGKQGA